MYVALVLETIGCFTHPLAPSHSPELTECSQMRSQALPTYPPTVSIHSSDLLTHSLKILIDVGLSKPSRISRTAVCKFRPRREMNAHLLSFYLVWVLKTRPVSILRQSFSDGNVTLAPSLRCFRTRAPPESERSGRRIARSHRPSVEREARSASPKPVTQACPSRL
jgi:hypothetical protein